MGRKSPRANLTRQSYSPILLAFSLVIIIFVGLVLFLGFWRLSNQQAMLFNSRAASSIDNPNQQGGGVPDRGGSCGLATSRLYQRYVYGQSTRWDKAAYRCVGDQAERIADAEAQGQATRQQWATKLNFYCQIPCAGVGVGVGDPCTRYTNSMQCNQAPRYSGIARENCGWYICANKCLTKETPMDYACPQPTPTPTTSPLPQEQDSGGVFSPTEGVNGSDQTISPGL